MYATTYNVIAAFAPDDPDIDVARRALRWGCRNMLGQPLIMPYAEGCLELRTYRFDTSEQRETFKRRVRTAIGDAVHSVILEDEVGKRWVPNGR